MSDPRDRRPPEDPGTGPFAPPPGTGQFAPPPPGTGPYAPPPPTGQFEPPPAGTGPYAPPPRGSDAPPWSRQRPDPGTQAWQAPPTASGWQAAGSSGWSRPQEMPVLTPPDERGWGPPAPPRRRTSPPLLAPLVALIGLIVVAGGTVFAAQRLDLLSTAAAPTATAGFTSDPNATDEPIGTYDPDVTDDPNATDQPAPDETATPSGPTPVPTAFVTPPPNEQATVVGTLLFGRGGDIWQVQGTAQSKLIESGEGDAIMPVWSPDGRLVYYVQRTVQRGKTAPWGTSTSRADTVTHMATDIMSVRADGSDKTRRFRSMHKEGQGYWSTVAIQPDVTPDGRTLVLVSDLGVVPSADYRIAGVVLSTMSTNGRGLRSLDVDSRTNNYGDALGHNDPDISPNGKRIAFTYADKGGGQGQGTPRIGIVKYPVKKSKPDLSPKRRSYANPDWSPDGRYLAAERVTPDKRDVVILDPDTWEEVARLTTNGQSFAPVWSPNGDQIAYLHVDGLKVDVRIMTLARGSTGFTLVSDQAVTVDGDVDPESAPAWFVPQDQRVPLPTAPPTTPTDEASQAAGADATEGQTPDPSDDATE